MPEKLPAPEDGTAEQAGPNGFDAVCADWVGMAEDDDEDGVPDPEFAEVPLEPHAAAPNARPAEMTAMAGTLYFIFWTPHSLGYETSGLGQAPG
jgi:hypothetical protein